MIVVDGEKLMQWDKGRFIRINDEATFTEVHFYKTGDTVALVVKPTQDGDEYLAAIPNVLLQNDKSIGVLLVYKDGDVEKVVSSASFLVGLRAKPADYVYTETEILTYENLEKRVEALESWGVGNAGKLLYVDNNGNISVLSLGAGLAISNGVLYCIGGGSSGDITSAVLGTAILGSLKLGG